MVRGTSLKELLLGLLIATSVLGCATDAGPIRMESRSVARELGLEKCSVSVPMQPDDVIEIGQKWDLYTDPNKDPEWGRVLEKFELGDAFRLVSCDTDRAYYYALIRNGAVIGRYDLLVLD